jgi:phage/plasmid-associated DNA primase
LNGAPLKEGRPSGGGGDIDTVKIAQTLLEERKLYSDLDLGLLYEAENGFLEDITKELSRYLGALYPALRESDYNDIIFKLKIQADKMPVTNPDLIVFKNGVYSLSQRKLIETEEIADMGFREYNYLEKAEPTKFIEIMFSDIKLDQYPVVKAGLRSIIKSRMDAKISVIHGKSAVGKSTGLTILGMILGDEYHFTTTVADFINDRATRSKIKNKRLLIFQDMPDKFKDFSIIKSVAGEHKQSIRGFNQANSSFTNKLKIWGSCNYLPEIPEKERNPMFTQRLSLIVNTRTIPFEANDSFAEDVVNAEGEQILSYLVNLKEEECQYENAKALSKRWLSIQSPEITFLDKYYEVTDESMVEYPAIRVLKKFREVTGEKISLDTLISTMKNEGYSIKYGSNIISNIKDKVIPVEKSESTRQDKL